MFSRQQAAIQEALLNGNTPQLVDALCRDQQALTHNGPITLNGTFAREDRGYCTSCDGLPSPPVTPPRNEAAVLTLNGPDDETGESGFAQRVNGLAYFSIPPHVMSWATVESSGTTVNGYVYTDGHAVDNSKGDSATAKKVRVFYQSENATPPAGDGYIVGYIADRNGLNYGIVGKASEYVDWDEFLTEDELLDYLPAGTSDGQMIYWDTNHLHSINPAATLSVLMSNGSDPYWQEVETQQVLTDFQVDGTNRLVQVKVRDIYVVPAGEESDWITAHTGDDCE